MTQLTLLCARQVLSKESDIDEEEHIRSSAKLYIMAVEAIKVQKRLGV